MQNKKHININLFLSIIAIALVSIFSFSMARYMTTYNKEVSGTAAKWNVNVYINDNMISNLDTVYNLNLADTMSNGNSDLEALKIAPGSSGKIDVKVDATGTETGVEYTIDFSLTGGQLPSNLNFYTSQDYNQENKVDLTKQQLKYIALNEVDTPQINTFYWIWEKVDDETTNAEEIANSGSNLVLNIKVTASQYIDIIVPAATDEKFFTVSDTGELTLSAENLTEFISDVGELVIPSSIEGVQVTSVGQGAFKGIQSINSVVISDGIEEIGESAFEGCSSIEYVIGKQVKQIGKNAFYNCESMKTIRFSEGLERIENWAFDNCNSLTTITLPETITYLGESAFYNCTSLQSINIPENITVINKWTFWNCSSLNAISIPNNVLTIEEGAFGNCIKLASVSLGTGLTKIGDSAFYNNTSLEEIVIPDNVLQIENQAFAKCTNLKEAIVPEQCTIGENVFLDTKII